MKANWLINIEFTYETWYDEPAICPGSQCYSTYGKRDIETYIPSDGFIPASSASGWDGPTQQQTVMMKNNSHFEIRGSTDTRAALDALFTNLDGLYGERFEITHK